MITASLLGTPELRINGEVPPPPLRWKKHLGLLILLWSSRHRQLSRDTALAMLWGDRDEHDARHSLNEALRVIRRHCGADAIDASGDLIRWCGTLELDTDQFASLESGDPTRAAELVRGEWCEGFTVPEAREFQHRLDDERRMWRPRLVATLASAASVAADRGEIAAAMRQAELACSIDPLSEVAARALIMTRAIAGDRAAALVEADAFSQRLKDELGVEPDPTTVRLLRRVADSRGSVGLRGGERSGSEVPFIGRAEQLGRLLGAMRTAISAGRSALLIIDGDPGSGRTRLLEEVALRGGPEGVHVLTVRAVPSDASSADSGWRAIAGSGLVGAAGIAATPPEAIAVLAASSPVWMERYGAGNNGLHLPLHSAVTAALRAAATERPVLLALDDVEWLDGGTVGQIPGLLRDLADLPFIVVTVIQRGSLRPEIDALRRHVDRPDRGADATTTPMSAAELGAAAVAVLPSWDGDSRDRLVRRLLLESAGLPAIAVGILRAVVQGLSLDELGQSWPAPDRTWDATLPSSIPDALTAGIRLRYHQLPEADRNLLVLVAVSAAPLTEERLESLTGSASTELSARLDWLEQDRWLVSDGRGYRFRAPAVGTLVAREMLTPGRRQRLERQLDSGS